MRSLRIWSYNRVFLGLILCLNPWSTILAGGWWNWTGCQTCFRLQRRLYFIIFPVSSELYDIYFLQCVQDNKLVCLPSLCHLWYNECTKVYGGDILSNILFSRPWARCLAATGPEFCSPIEWTVTPLLSLSKNLECGSVSTSYFQNMISSGRIVYLWFRCQISISACIKSKTDTTGPAYFSIAEVCHSSPSGIVSLLLGQGSTNELQSVCAPFHGQGHRLQMPQHAHPGKTLIRFYFGSCEWQPNRRCLSGAKSWAGRSLQATNRCW